SAIDAKQREYTVALVGCGRISKNHFDALRQVNGLRLTAVCDSEESRARAAGEQEGVPWFTSYEEMLRDAECDVVAVCTPSGVHAVQGAAAANAGNHAATEKPM